MPSKLFVGNLSFRTTKDDLQKLMQAAGTITDIYLPIDRATGQPRGFAFVTYSTDEEAASAIARFNGHDLDGRALRVNLAEERPPRPRGFAPPGPRFDGGSDFFGGGRASKPKGSRRGLRARKRGG
ncbi:MAG: RNA-binding protein [Deltaproteobacteria bacterium]|nr:RNA-binding protein [Deltaproteobacteria bacterium]